MNRTDADLIEALQRGDEHALAELLSRHAPGIYRFGLKMCRDPEDARDVVQDTLLAAARKVRDFRGASSISTWLYAIARSFCIKKRRGAKPAAVSLDDEPLAVETASRGRPPDEVVADRQLGDALERAIASLEPASREVLVLRDIEGLSAAEVAEVLGIRAEAVKSRLHRARVAVRSKLEPFFPTPATSKPAQTCPDVAALFSRYVEGEIGPDACADMERHIQGCPRCGATCESLKRTLALCRSIPTGPVPQDVQRLVREALGELRSRAHQRSDAGNGK